ncbi:2-oxo acid dehydrogenase subunit E2 [Paenibacillaceae bacterium]|nr:2-oxo acid dehydrogenase subunit E2 [Paenibacillaceae bacterium]
MTSLTEIVMPQLAESLVSATIDKWLKQPGDSIEMYEPICEVLTDKVNAELPSTVRGKLVKILVGNGEKVDVGVPICIVETAEDLVETAQATEQTGAVQHAPTNAAGVSQVHLSEDDGDMRGRYSPAVQKLAAEHAVDLTRLQGTGLGGRITRKDVLAYVSSPERASQPPQPQSQPLVTMDPKIALRTTGIHLNDSPRTPAIEVEGRAIPGRGEYFIDITPTRETIATRMRQSVTEIPHAWTMIEVDVTNLVILRNKLKDEFKKREGFNLTYLAFMMKAVVSAIKDYPIMNSVWAVDKIVVKRDINLSLVVGTEDSVLTPVIKNADQKNIAGLAREVDELARKTREGKLTLSDMQGGTFTVNNTGAFGSILSYPIINYPQAVNLTFESIVKRPVVINDMIAVRSMVNLCLSLDHRILDGVICGRFLQRVKENLESYNLDTQLY